MFHSVGFRSSILPLFISIFFISGCKADRAPDVQIQPSQTESRPSPISEDRLAQDNIERYEFDSLITDTIFVEFPIIAVVQDQAIRYPDWTDRWPEDGEIETLHQFEVTLVEALKGNLPQSFHFYSFGDDVPSIQKDGPYMVALCRVGDKFFADSMIGRLPSHIVGFDELMRQRLATAKPEDFGPETCAFEIDLPE